VRAVGFWFSSNNTSLPRPQWLVDPTWSLEERAVVVRYLRSGTAAQHWCGYSWCRFECGVDRSEIGASDLTDGEWLWPEGLAHYVGAHSVRVPDELIARALGPRARAAVPADRFDQEDDYEVERDWWLRWAAKRGACVVLDPGWTSLDPLETSAAVRQLHELSVADISGASAWLRRNDGDAILCTNFRVVSLRTGQILAGMTGDPRSSDHVIRAPPLSIPTESELRTWAAQILTRPMTDILNPVIVWVPDGLDTVVRNVLTLGRYIQLRSRSGIGGRWQRFSRALPAP